MTYGLFHDCTTPVSGCVRAPSAPCAFHQNTCSITFLSVPSETQRTQKDGVCVCGAAGLLHTTCTPMRFCWCLFNFLKCISTLIALSRHVLGLTCVLRWIGGGAHAQRSKKRVHLTRCTHTRRGWVLEQQYEGVPGLND